MDLNEESFPLPKLEPNGREREFNQYSDDLKSKVIYEHLFQNQTHRWLDKNVLGIVSGNTNGRNSANILYYLGMKANYRGIFRDLDLNKGIEILKKGGKDYKITVSLLEIYSKHNLSASVRNDINSERIEDGEGLEGDTKYYYGKKYERNNKNRELAIEIHGLNCMACGFNFEHTYGIHGKNFIEVHHIKPLSTLEEEMHITPETDLVPLCANCHRMIHRNSTKVLSVDELKRLLKRKEN